MRYFAEIIDNIVQRVIVVESSEYAHQLFGGEWVETFPNDMNKNYANIGYTYIPELKNFHSTRPKLNWILDTTDLRWKPSPKSYHHLFFEKPPILIVTEDNKIYTLNENNEWNEV